MKPKWKILLIAVVIPLAVGGVSALLTAENMAFFDVLRKPPLSPPGWLFPVVWTVLYILMGLASGLVFMQSQESEEAERALRVYVVQLVFNFFWSILFFNCAMFGAAFLWLVALWVLILVTTVRFYRIRPAAGYLMIPYLLWVTFAGYLNFAIWRLNG